VAWQINTAFVERLNLTIRQHVAAIGRRVSTLCKGEDGLRQQLAFVPLLLQLLFAPMLAYASPSRSPNRPMARARPRCGGPVHQPWQRA